MSMMYIPIQDRVFLLLLLMILWLIKEVFTFVKSTIKSGSGINADHTLTHRLMASIHSGDRYPYSCVAMGMSVIPEDYHLL